MIQKTITYEDFNGVKRTEEAHFHLSKPEIMEMQLSVDGGYDEKIKRIMNSQDNREIYNLYKEIVMASYGIKTPDGKQFLKTDVVDGHKYVNEFIQSEAFNTLFIQLLSNADEFAAFVNGIMPADIREQAAKITSIEEAKAIAAEAMR